MSGYTSVRIAQLVSILVLHNRYSNSFQHPGTEKSSPHEAHNGTPFEDIGDYGHFDSVSYSQGVIGVVIPCAFGKLFLDEFERSNYYVIIISLS